jgi:hypothetical protein
MHIPLKLTAIVLSVLTGVAFASPLFYSDMIRPFRTPQGPTANMVINVAYAEFKVRPANSNAPLPKWVPKNETPYDLAYNVVLNVTNDCDNAAILNYLYFCGGKNVVEFSNLFSTSETIRGVFGAWVDGIWYNVTIQAAWANSQDSQPRVNWSSGDLIVPAPKSFNSPFDLLFLMQGVQICEHTVNGSVIATWLNMNGTWTDVTGRITVTGDEPPHSPTKIMSYPFVAETRNFGRVTYTRDIDYSAASLTSVGEGEFSNIWQPHQSRLIVLNGTRIIPSSSALTLTTGQVYLQMQSGTHLVNNYINGTKVDTHAQSNSIQQIQLQTNGDTYIYNAVLNGNATFQLDKYGVEAFIEPRS